MNIRNTSGGHTMSRFLLASLSLLLTLPLAGCLMVGGSSRGGFFIWPSGGVLLLILVIFLLMRRR